MVASSFDATLGSTLAAGGSDPMMLRIEDCESLRLPPGLELPVDRIEGWFASSSCHPLMLQAGLPAKVLADASDGFESDDTSVGSAASSESSQSDMAYLGMESSGLILSEVSQLKASSPSFVPVLSPLPDTPKQAPSRSKLNSQAGAFIPSSMMSTPLPFMPMATVRKAWQDWSDTARPLMPLPFVPMATVREAWQNLSDKSPAEDAHDWKQ